ncbi:hypothetical protein HG536_0D04970 [Torulaspora globosa]|uniref:2'-phosphotransferase n=1 Tax=Torulaspora globosa TaxID=48254 RepID=A0A7G3ZHI9_9SACH|nr:uncharacterized protein HG536_0D04970 [Torulaspora globosa]QLL32975.1 hypothetical protein HG536_0D04970 [Torulaspora globosa]
MSQNADLSKRDVQISKALSYLLRHGALKEKLPIDTDGYVPVAVLLAHNRLKCHKCTLEDIHRIVENNDKKRFHIVQGPLSDGQPQELICATQGHSIAEINPSEDVLHEITDAADLPATLIHGTSITKLLLILQSGSIKRRGRNHVHLSPGVSGRDSQVVSGMRNSSNAHIHLKRGQQLLDQLQLFRSLNNVYLTPNDIPASLFEKVVIRPPKNAAKAADDLHRVRDLLANLHIPMEVSSGPQ